MAGLLSSVSKEDIDGGNKVSAGNYYRRKKLKGLRYFRYTHLCSRSEHEIGEKKRCRLTIGVDSRTSSAVTRFGVGDKKK